jgi:hypothetical protein
MTANTDICAINFIINKQIMTAVEYLAEKYNYITWMRNRDEISAGTADELRAKFLKEAKEMEREQMNKVQNGVNK